MNLQQNRSVLRQPRRAAGAALGPKRDGAAAVAAGSLALREPLGYDAEQQHH
ncbi:hypothetical protein [Pseudophaeobacter sp.]|uniref:hypothetical protein n=1 Tax=Pseudophaeobacter sp. TaxID=1971739 RepID=UPI004058ABA7